MKVRLLIHDVPKGGNGFEATITNFKDVRLESHPDGLILHFEYEGTKYKEFITSPEIKGGNITFKVDLEKSTQTYHINFGV